MEIQAQILEEIKQIENDDYALNKLLVYLRKLISSSRQTSSVDDSIVKGIKEIELEKKGKLRLNTLENLIHELGD